MEAESGFVREALKKVSCIGRSSKTRRCIRGNAAAVAACCVLLLQRRAGRAVGLVTRSEFRFKLRQGCQQVKAQLASQMQAQGHSKYVFHWGDVASSAQ